MHNIDRTALQSNYGEYAVEYESELGQEFGYEFEGRHEFGWCFNWVRELSDCNDL